MVRLQLATHLHAPRPHDSLVLPFVTRQKSRFRGRLASGAEVAVVVPRGHVLRDGQHLIDAAGELVVQVHAAAEQVSTVAADAPQALLRAAYHLGNRHVPLQVGDGWLRYGHDHVLDAMVRSLGLRVQMEYAPFEPEAGAYGSGAHGAHTHGAHTHGALPDDPHHAHASTAGEDAS